jgi:tRNA pseudouridine38-40 synthase
MRAYRLAYDGRPFYGFQRQPDVPTVEDTLFDALRDLDVLDPDADKPEGYAAAGRTDRGVSAVAQTVAFESPDWLSPTALNSELPADVRAWAAADAPADFHATHDATGREYTYHLYAPGVDADRARTALAALCGKHDFHNLTPDETNTVRDLSGEVVRDGDFLVFVLRAGGFPRELVRRVVSLVHAVAAGDAPLSKVDRALGRDPLDGPEGVAPAPPTPLVLTDVAYPDLSFAVDEEAAETVREVFDEKRVEGLVAVRVAGAIVQRVGDAFGAER